MSSDLDLKRYDLEETSGNPWQSHRDMVSSDDGDWVEAEAALALVARIRELEARVDELGAGQDNDGTFMAK